MIEVFIKVYYVMMGQFVFIDDICVIQVIKWVVDILKYVFVMQVWVFFFYVVVIGDGYFYQLRYLLGCFKVKIFFKICFKIGWF